MALLIRSLAFLSSLAARRRSSSSASETMGKYRYLSCLCTIDLTSTELIRTISIKKDPDFKQQKQAIDLLL